MDKDGLRNDHSGKGKGKGKEAADSQGGPGPSKEDNFSSRILNSAAGLSSSVLGSGSRAPPRFEGVGFADKSSSGSGNSADHTTADPGLVRHVAGGSKTSRLRVAGKDESEKPFGEFLGHSPGDAGIEADITGLLNDDARRPSGVRERTLEKQEAQDGEEVLALLSDHTSIRFADSVDFGGFSAHLPRLRAALFSDRATPSSDWDRLLNFWPVADDDLVSGITHPSGKSAWLAQWKDVLTSYSDEVWGELAMDVKYAEEEVEAVLQESSEPDVSGLGSLRRLQQILAHLRGV